MVMSMTGYGHGRAESEGIRVAVEIRTVNGRFLEVIPRLPRSLALRENDVKELVRRRIARGKVNLLVTVERETDGAIPLRVNVQAARAYYKLLNDVRKAVRLRQTVRLEHVLQFSEIFEQQELEETNDQEWKVLQLALEGALADLVAMRAREGSQLEVDFLKRLDLLSEKIDTIEAWSREQVPRERDRLRERVGQLFGDQQLDHSRLELELAIMADKLDVTEECVRFRSHVKFFREALASEESAGRRLNFLVQELNREANTIGSKSSDIAIAHAVVAVKEELEKIREQLQNIE
jgi:uncharacterized protein (TIGR00255 family)